MTGKSVYLIFFALMLTACGSSTGGSHSDHPDASNASDSQSFEDGSSSSDDIIEASEDIFSEDAVETRDATLDSDVKDSDNDTPPSGFGDPIEVEPEQLEEWVWLSMPEMRCADDSDGGMAVNMTDRSGDLLFFLQGGGICFNDATCTVGGAARNVGDDPINTAIDSSIRDGVGIFDRNDPTNPMRDMNYVVIPHCTGDFHMGTKVTQYLVANIHHYGYLNIQHAIERLVPTFYDADQIILAGFSAGGVGITGNYHQLADAFESVGQPSPYLIDDAGPMMRPEFFSPNARNDLKNHWGLDDSIGTFCPSCLEDGFHEIYRVNAEQHPTLRQSLLSSYADGVVVTLYTVFNLGFSATQLRAGLNDLANWLATISDDFLPGAMRVFYYDGDRHGALITDALSATPGLNEFLDEQLGDGEWDNVRP